MSMGTQKVHGQGFVVLDVPNYLAEDGKAHPSTAFKGKASAERAALREALWVAKNDIEGVEGVVAVQIDGFEGLWFLVWIYTDEAAARIVDRFNKIGA